MGKIKVTKEQLEDLFVKQNLPLNQIAKQLNCSRSAITRSLQRYGLKTGTSYKKPVIKEDPLKDYKEQIKSLYLSGKSCSEIGKLLGKSEKTISHHLQKMKVPIRSTKKMDQDQFVELWNAGKTIPEIAEYFGVSVNTVLGFKTRGENKGKFIRPQYFSQTEQVLSYLQEQFILGSLLGDLNLANPKSSRHKNSRLAIVHCEKQKELFMKKVELLGYFMGSWKYCTPKPDKRTGKVYSGYRGNSKTHKVFTDIYNSLYINGVKTITPEYLAKITHPIALAYWFMDDGSYNGNIATNSFTEQEVDFLIEWMAKKWNILCSKTHVHIKDKVQYIIHISENSRPYFEDLIKPYIVTSMQYKLKYAN